MDRLPDELVLYVLDFLTPSDIVHVQQISKRYLALARDAGLWRRLCFWHSRATTDLELTGKREVPGGDTAVPRLGDADASVERGQVVRSRSTRISCRLSNWDPTYHNETHDFYEDYITRHACISLNWMDMPRPEYAPASKTSEVIGATLFQPGTPRQYALSALDDGTVVICDLSTQATSDSFQRKSTSGLIKPGRSDPLLQYMQMRNTGGPDNISIHGDTNRAYFAVSNILQEVDLERLALVSSSVYPSSISALSACTATKPLVVGTENTLHIHDSRDPMRYVIDTAQHSCVVPIARYGLSPPYITLAERGPLSILHPPDNSDSIWVVGRFTSILQHSIRFFPRLVSNVHSGARISQLTALPYPFVPTRRLESQDNVPDVNGRHLRPCTVAGWTAVCAGEYKGKGSLELFGFSAPEGTHTGEKYLNRQTAARSKLLAVASHSGKLVHSDGNGMLKWVERNGSTVVREFNINAHTQTRSNAPARNQQSPRPDAIRYGPEQIGGPPQATQDRTIQDAEPIADGDIVQKIVPFCTESALTNHATDKLLLWTGDGRLGVLGFGPSDPLHREEWHDAVEAQAETAVERAHRDAEAQFQSAMRRALQRNADEVRFVRGLGIA